MYNNSGGVTLLQNAPKAWLLWAVASPLALWSVLWRVMFLVLCVFLLPWLWSNAASQPHMASARAQWNFRNISVHR